MNKEQFLASDWWTYLWVVGVSLWGGVVSFFGDEGKPFTWLRLFAHLSSASFAGMMTFYICQYGNVPEPLVGVFCGVAAHMGTPALLKLKVIRQFLDKGKDEA